MWDGFQQQRADIWASTIPDDVWQRLSCGDGVKGPRLYDWALLYLPRWEQSSDIAHGSLVRRGLDDGELAYYVIFTPAGTPLQTLVTVAGTALDD